jgi:hypothetical protein
MPKFRLHSDITVSAYCEVEAISLEAAKKIAEGMHGELSFNGSGNSPKDAWLVEDVDGEATNIRGEEIPDFEGDE